MADLSRITLDPDICHGKPCVRHMRWPVEVVLDLVSSGMGLDEIVADHPELEREDILACLHTLGCWYPVDRCSAWLDEGPL
jgi:uncharacterized protein (DUF433 family)